MPEVVEVFMMMQSMKKILEGKDIARVTILGGRYQRYKIQDEKGDWVSQVSHKSLIYDKYGNVMYDDEHNEMTQTTWKNVTIEEYPHAVPRSMLENDDIFVNQGPMKVQSHNVHGKFCWIELENNWYIAFTFGMSGAIYYEPTPEILANYNKGLTKPVTEAQYRQKFHVKFESSDGSCFYFADPRRFGTINISNNRSELKKKLNKLGPDIFSHTPLTNEQFIKRMRLYNHQNICKALMEQKAISGVGNYIKAEALYHAKVNPWADVSDLTDQNLIDLYDGIKYITQLAYSKCGASLYTYVSSSGEKTDFKQNLKVYAQITDPNGLKVVFVSDSKSPDKRGLHYVPSIQIVGQHRDPSHIKLNQPKMKITIKDTPSIATVSMDVPKIKIELKKSPLLNSSNQDKIKIKLRTSIAI